MAGGGLGVGLLVTVAVGLALGACVGLVLLSRRMDWLRTWVLAHDDELAELHDGLTQRELLARLRKRGGPVEPWTE